MLTQFVPCHALNPERALPACARVRDETLPRASAEALKALNPRPSKALRTEKGRLKEGPLKASKLQRLRLQPVAGWKS